MNVFAETNRLYNDRNYRRMAVFVKYLNGFDMNDHWFRFQRDYAQAAWDVMRGLVWSDAPKAEAPQAEARQAIFGETGQLDLNGAWHPPVAAPAEDRVTVGAFFAWNVTENAATAYAERQNFVYYVVDAIDDTPVGMHVLLRKAGLGLESGPNYNRQNAAAPATHYLPVGDLADWPTFEEMSEAESRIEAEAMAAAGI